MHHVCPSQGSAGRVSIVASNVPTTQTHKSEGGQLRQWAQDQLNDCRRRRDLRVVRWLQRLFNQGMKMETRSHNT